MELFYAYNSGTGDFSDVKLSVETSSTAEVLSTGGNAIKAVLTIAFSNLDSDSCLPNGMIESGTLELGLSGTERTGSSPTTSSSKPRYDITEYSIRTISPLVVRMDDNRVANVSISQSKGSGIAIIFQWDNSTEPPKYGLYSSNEPFNLLETLFFDTELTINGETVVVGQISALSLTYSPAKARGFLPKPQPQECHALQAWSYRA